MSSASTIPNLWNKLRSANNRRATTHLQATPNYIDWEVTTLFYAALHLVDAYAIRLRVARPIDHTERNDWVRNDPRFEPVRRAYRRLYILSRSARYDRDITALERDDALLDYFMIVNFLSPKI